MAIKSRKVKHYRPKDLSCRKPTRLVLNVARLVLLVQFCIFFIFPIYCLVVKSFMSNEQLFDSPSLWPNGINLDPYKTALSGSYIKYFGNTFLVCLCNILGVVFSSSFTAFGLTKMQFKGRGFCFALILGTVLLPGTVTSIPLYIIYNDLNWVGTLLPLCVPIWFGGGAMNIFLVSQFMRGIPSTYTDAAKIDGAGPLRIYLEIVLPLCKPILIYLAITTFFATWNDFSGPLLYVKDNPDSWTLSLALYEEFANVSSTSAILPNVQMAVGVLMMIPCVILFAFFQKSLMEGVSKVGVKG